MKTGMIAFHTMMVICTGGIWAIPLVIKWMFK